MRGLHDTVYQLVRYIDDSIFSPFREDRMVREELL
jgi:hypothetical protein